jgi:hydroxyacylglutathione hydrolase
LSWTEIAPGLRVRQSRAYRMNSTLLLHPDGAALIDPGVLPSEMDEIAAAVRATDARHTMLVFTHAHWDHVLGRVWWPALGTIAHAEFAADLRRGEHRVDHAARDYVRGAGEPWDAVFEAFTPDLPVRGERPLQIGAWSLVFRDAFGHSDSQMSVHLPDQRVLIAADMLSDIELPILNRPPDVYRSTLRTLRPLMESGEIETLVPGHGSIATGAAAMARLRRDLGYLDALEGGVQESHARGEALEAARQRLAPLNFIAADAAFPMDKIHHENIRIAFEATTAAGERP